MLTNHYYLKTMNYIIIAIFSFFFTTLVYSGQEEVKLFDKRRNRSVPIELYVNSEPESKAKAGISKLPVAIINHGYGVKNTDYTFLANDLAAKGYFVISIQQDLPSDLPLPRTGNLFERRKPYWECGVQNLLFAISELKKIKPYINLNKVLLIGHSNGGDISMMFATNYPKQVSKVISLDSLRYPFPTKANIPILSLRANDTKADEGVLPQANEYIHIIPIGAKHIDMYDAAPIEVKQKIIDQISEFLTR
jgi:peptidoglycan-N-acetylglucosamine deacetylase